ncbi:hypothetical protein, partial [Salmonella enterica]|uniref:hypothetical protein n=1 Tax=Salmonella enterica TaxID=28901 RepID=UPI003CEE432D
MEPLEAELDLLEGRRLRQEGRVSAAARLLRHAHEKALRLGMPLLAFETAQDLYAAEDIPEHAHLLRAAEI